MTTPPVRHQSAIRGRNPLAPDITAELERASEVFRAALRAGFDTPDDASLIQWVEALPPPDRPVAWEAGAMAVVFLERATLSRRTWLSLREACGDLYRVSLALGRGWGLSWLGAPVEPTIESLPSLERWRVLDGYGFRDGLVAPMRHLLVQKEPYPIVGFARAMWVQGLGRSLWYTTRGDLVELAEVMGRFPDADQPALWRGLGTGATWIGSDGEAAMEKLSAAAGPHAQWLGTGSAMAARTRRETGTMTERQTAACAVLGGASPMELAALTDEAAVDLPEVGTGKPPFEVWMERLAESLEE